MYLLYIQEWLQLDRKIKTQVRYLEVEYGHHEYHSFATAFGYRSHRIKAEFEIENPNCIYLYQFEQVIKCSWVSLESSSVKDCYNLL